MAERMIAKAMPTPRPAPRATVEVVDLWSGVAVTVVVGSASWGMAVLEDEEVVEDGEVEAEAEAEADAE